tara:strand:+ start:8379 stop:8948 length:570 start_codon:yes stop_codon:yes gene_type:complete
MAKIENKIAYPLVKPQPNDYVVLTDVSDNNETKTCLVGDIMGFYPFEIFSTTLSADQVKNAEGNPVILLPAPGPGRMIIPEFFEGVFSVVSDNTAPVQFNCGGDGLIVSGNNTPTQVLCYGLPEANLNQVSNFPQNSIFGSNATTYDQDMGGLVNSNIIFTFAFNEGPTVGNGSLKINFRYRTVSGFTL